MIVTSRLELHPFTAESASVIAAGDAAGQQWAPRYPREDDRDAAEMFLRAPSAEFGSFEIRSSATKEAIGTIGSYGPPSTRICLSCIREPIGPGNRSGDGGCRR